jgi:hypothetical protein
MNDIKRFKLGNIIKIYYRKTPEIYSQLIQQIPNCVYVMAVGPRVPDNVSGAEYIFYRDAAVFIHQRFVHVVSPDFFHILKPLVLIIGK